MSNPPGWTAPGSSQPDRGQGGQGGPPGSQQGPPPGYGPAPGHGPPPGYPPGYAPPPGTGFGGPAQPPEPKPGIIPLRPIGLGEILDGAITYIRRNPKATLGLSAIVAGSSQALLGIIGVWLNTSASQLTTMRPQALNSFADVFGVIGPSLVALLLTIIITLLASLLLTGMLTAVIGRAVLGQPTTMGDAWQQALPRFPALLGASLLLILIIYPLSFAFAAAVLVTPGALVAYLASDLLGGVLIFLGSVGVVAVMAWIYVTFALATPAIVLERAGVLDALRRSYALVRGSWWRVFGILLLAWIIAIIIQSVFQIPFGAAQFAIGATGSFILAQLVATVGAILAVTVVSPFSSGVPALLYVDLRMRREGFDLQLQNAAGMPVPPPPTGPPGPPPPGPPPPAGGPPPYGPQPPQPPPPER